MKRLTEDNFYAPLGVDSNASSFEIIHAYKEASQLYNEDSLASYSFFSEEERQEILAKLDEAYSTLIDERKRSRYDQSLVERGMLHEGVRPTSDRNIFRCVSGSKHFANNTPLRIRNVLRAMVSSTPLIQEILTQDVLSGQDLRKIREELGVSLEVIAEMTRVRLVYLRAIEDDAFDKPPSRMFLKSFVKAYSQYMGLDAEMVATRYLKRIDG